jgi:hypothetical protein
VVSDSVVALQHNIRAAAAAAHDSAAGAVTTGIKQVRAYSVIKQHPSIKKKYDSDLYMHKLDYVEVEDGVSKEFLPLGLRLVRLTCLQSVR